MADIFEAKEKLLKDLGWEENPFVKDLRVFDRESFLRHYCPFESASILQKLAFDTKACLLLGPKGVGKTSALYHVYYSLPQNEFLPIMLKEPPASVNSLAKEAGFVKQDGFFDGFLSALRGKKEVSRDELVRVIKSQDKKVILFVDEAHLEPSKEMYMEFKYLLDEVPNLRMVFSALGQENFPDSLVQLIGTKNVFSRRGFSKEEMRTIVEHRISAVGGKGVVPFDEEFLGKAFTEQNLLTPRYVFDELNSCLAQIAAGEAAVQPYSDDPIVMAAVQHSKEQPITTAHAEWWIMLSPSQQGVMKQLFNHPEGMTLNELMVALQLSQNTCFNALYQLRGEDDAELKRKPEVPFPLVEVKTKLVGGRKKNIYFANQKVKNLFTLH
ncbi:hypothetical protein H0O03_04875 [Candidatus Micrarchaeota archaeon]|nr:hypothetical protein [Candidatus Micrarchaeota archaeon]